MIFNDITTKPQLEKVTFDKDVVLDLEGVKEMIVKLDTKLKQFNVETIVDINSDGVYEVHYARIKRVVNRKPRKNTQSGLNGFGSAFRQ